MVVMTVLQREPARRFQTATELERRLLTYVIGAPRAPEDTDVGLFIRSLFPTRPRRRRTPSPWVLSSSFPARGPTSSRAHSTARSGGLQQTRAETPGRLLQRTAPSGSISPVLEDEALAPTRTPANRRSSAATAPGGRQSVVTEAPVEEMRVLAAQIGARRRRTMLAILGLAVLLGVGAIAFVAGRTESRPEPSPPEGPGPTGPLAVVPPAPPRAPEGPAPTPPPSPRTEAAAIPPAAPGFLMVKAQPWGRLFVDGKYAGDVEGTRRLPLGPGSHTLRLVNGKKAKVWTVEVESGKTVSRDHSFLED
jgi:serine/threonine-protein kinase